MVRGESRVHFTPPHIKALAMAHILNPHAAQARFVALIDDLRALPGETAWVEFKANNMDADRMGRTLSGLANAACLADRSDAYIVWGLEDGSHKVVGTTFEPSSARRGNQALAMWLAQNLDPSPNFEFHVVDHPDGRLVVLQTAAATHAPVKFNGVPYIRIGSATPKLTDYPDRERALWSRLRSYIWETGVALQYVAPEDVVELLDVHAYFHLLKLVQPENRTGVLQRLEQDHLISEDVGGRWNILNLGAILLAHDLNRFPRLARKSLRIIEYEDKSRLKTRREPIIARGYASGFEEFVRLIGSILPRNEYIGQALREERSMYPEIAIRELVANALIHQDAAITGAGPMVEIFSDRIEITNPGRPLIEPERFIDSPPRSRNEAVAALMRRMNICEERGSGVDKVISQVEIFQLPPPDFRAGEDYMRVVLYAPRKFADMTPSERLRACYQHAALRWMAGERATNASLRQRFGVSDENSAQVSRVLRDALAAKLIKRADPAAPKSGYAPIWA